MGPGDEAICETTATLIKIMNGEMRIGIEGSFHLADARDLAHGCVAAADRGRSGECYILGNEEITFQEMYELLHDASGCRKPMFYVPPAAAYHLVSGMERELADNGKKPMITDFAVYNLERNNDFDLRKQSVSSDITHVRMRKRCTMRPSGSLQKATSKHKF